MRNILFRGKALSNGKWLYGSYVCLDDTTWCFTEDYERHPENTHHYIVYETMTDWNHHMVEVDGNTVGQYTGCDDKYGERIFEGDIIRKRTYHGMEECTVKFSNGCFMCGWGGGSSTGSHPYLLNDKNITVVGNIYDGGSK